MSKKYFLVFEDFTVREVESTLAGGDGLKGVLGGIEIQKSSKEYYPYFMSASKKGSMVNFWEYKVSKISNECGLSLTEIVEVAEAKQKKRDPYYIVIQSKIEDDFGSRLKLELTRVPDVEPDLKDIQELVNMFFEKVKDSKTIAEIELKVKVELLE